MDATEIEEEEAVFGSNFVVHGNSSFNTSIPLDVQELFAKLNPLGLTLTKTPSLLNFFETYVSTQFNNRHHNQVGTNLVAEPSTEKLKATNFPICSITIGDWQRNSQNVGDLIAKFYYAKRKIVWEVLDEEVVGNKVKLKSKIEILWSNIIALKAIVQDDQLGILKIELDEPPVFFRETEPKPKKHTNWESKDGFDFTNGHALISRIHCAIFPPKVLDKPYENLLQSDGRLFKLSRDHFPSQSCSYFQSAIVMSNFNRSKLPIIQQYNQCLTNNQSSPPNSVMGSPRNYQFEAQRFPNQEMNYSRANTEISPLSSPSFSSRFVSQAVPASQVCFTGQPNGHLSFEQANLHGQMQDMNDINLNDHNLVLDRYSHQNV